MGEEQNVNQIGEVVAVSISKTCNEPKQNQEKIHLIAGRGAEEDAHAGLSEREVSMLSIEAVRVLNAEHDAEAVPGSFAENITTMGINLTALPIGQRLRIGDALLEVVQIGKPLDVAHTYNFKGFSLLPKHGIFCRVLESGDVWRTAPICLVREDR